MEKIGATNMENSLRIILRIFQLLDELPSVSVAPTPRTVTSTYQCLGICQKQRGTPIFVGASDGIKHETH